MRQKLLAISLIMFTLTGFYEFSFSQGKQAVPLSWLTIVEEIKKNLDKLPSAYKEGKYDEAKSYITDAYFGVFEDKKFEQEIRVNISAKRAFEIESMFGDIRKAINRKSTLDEIESIIKDFSKHPTP